MDDLSALGRQVLFKLFGANYPIRVGIGVCGGFGAKVGWAIGLAYHPNSPLFKVLNDFPTYYYSLIFASLLMLPIAFGYRGRPEGVAHNIKTIQALLDAAESTKPQRSYVWYSLIQKYLEAIEPNLRSTFKIPLVEEAKKEIDAQSSEAKEVD